MNNPNKEIILKNLKASQFFDDSGINLKVIKRDPELDYPLHHHDFYELVYVINGRGTHFTEEEQQPLRRGDVFCIVPGFFHGYKNCENLAIYNILIRTAFIENSTFDVKKMKGFKELFLPPRNTFGRLHLFSPQRHNAEKMIETLKTETENHSSTYGTETKSISTFLSFLVDLCRVKENPSLENGKNMQAIQKVLDYIEQTLDRTVTIEELLQAANMSESGLDRYFKASTGLSPVQYQIQQRINKACNMIIEGKFNIEQIAEKTGFSDPNYFSRAFKKTMHITPSQYKKQWSAQN